MLFESYRLCVVYIFYFFLLLTDFFVINSILCSTVFHCTYTDRRQLDNRIFKWPSGRAMEALLFIAQLKWSYFTFIFFELEIGRANIQRNFNRYFNMTFGTGPQRSEFKLLFDTGRQDERQFSNVLIVVVIHHRFIGIIVPKKAPFSLIC